MVTDDHIHQYQEDGYCLVPGLLPTDLMESVGRRVLEIANDLPDWPGRHFQVLDPAFRQSDMGKPLPVGLQRPGQEEPLFQTVVEHPRLIDAMAGLLNGPVERFTDQIGIKYGWNQTEQGGRSYFHQDSWYWKIDPKLGCNCWIPTSSVDRDAIALAVMPQSHREWILTEHESYFDDPPMGRVKDRFKPFKRHRIPLDGIDHAREDLIPMEPGDALFFSNYTWHRSEPNRTGETKSFYAIAYQRSA